MVAPCYRSAAAPTCWVLQRFLQLWATAAQDLYYSLGLGLGYLTNQHEPGKI